MTVSRYSIQKVLPAALAAVLLAGSQQAFAWYIVVVNDLSDDLTNGQVENRQDIKLKSDPPKTIAAGERGRFEVAPGDSELHENPHLKVEYQVGSTGEVIEFGIRPTDSDIRCFTETPSGIDGSVSHCKHEKSDTTEYRFSPAQ